MMMQSMVIQMKPTITTRRRTLHMVERQTSARALRTEIAKQLLGQGVHGLQVDVLDEAVAAASMIAACSGLGIE